jgi:SAM-dependent methyltransferase
MKVYTKSYTGVPELLSIDKYLVNYNKNLASLFYSYCPVDSFRVLDFGAGIGTLSKYWHEISGVKPICVEIDPKLREILKDKGYEVYESLDNLNDESFDIVFSSNVLEHINDDSQVLRVIKNKLKHGGRLLLYLPAFPILYSAIDKKIGHYRRYSKKDILRKLRNTEFVTIELLYSDCLGFFGWYLSNFINDGAIKFYDKYIFGISNFIDNMGVNKFIGKNLFSCSIKA